MGTDKNKEGKILPFEDTTRYMNITIASISFGQNNNNEFQYNTHLQSWYLTMGHYYIEKLPDFNFNITCDILPKLL